MNNQPPAHIINFDDQIFCFEFSKNDRSQNLCCVALSSKLVLGVVKLPEESENECFEWIQLKELHNESRCHALAFSPETSLAILPKLVTVAVAGADFKLRIYSSDLNETNTIRILKKHSNYINALDWEPDGEFLASVSDDHSCILWNCKDDYEPSTIFYLNSAGMAVKWHPDEKEKLMVAEKNGLIHLYNVISQQNILSIESNKSPLMSADWAPSNRGFVVALAAGELILWDLRKPSRPIETKQIHEDGGLIIKFSPHNELITASIGRPDRTLKIYHSKSQLPQLSASLKLFGGLCFHYSLPYVAATIDRKLCLWNILSK